MKGKKLSAKETEDKLQVDSEFRKSIFRGLLDHVRRGYSVDCYGPIGEDSIRRYLISFKEEFVEEELIKAMRDAKQGWEDIGSRQSNGTCLGNSRSWVYNMMNRYGWTDKAKIETKGEQQVNVSIVNYSTKKPSKSTPEQ